MSAFQACSDCGRVCVDLSSHQCGRDGTAAEPISIEDLDGQTVLIKSPIQSKGVAHIPDEDGGSVCQVSKSKVTNGKENGWYEATASNLPHHRICGHCLKAIEDGAANPRIEVPRRAER